MTDKKTDHFNGKWAVVTIHERLPSKSEQVARARAWGVSEDMMGRDDISALILDDVTGVRTTNWPKKLVERGSFIAAMSRILPAGDQVWFCTPLCVGFTVNHARDTIEALWSCGMQVYVHSVQHNGPALYVAGDDITELLAMVASQQNSSTVRKSRGKS